MKNVLLKYWATVMSVVLTAGSYAAPVEVLNASGAGTPDANVFPSFASATVVASSVDAPFSTGGNGRLTTQILSGVDFALLSGGAVTYSGLTFVYELSNIAASGYQGITDLAVSGWGSTQIAVAFGQSLSSSNYSSTPNPALVQPGQIYRSFDGDTLTFSFPPGYIEPPIFAGQTGMQLIVFTDAMSYRATHGTVFSDEFDAAFNQPIGNPIQQYMVSTLTAAAVAVQDSGATVLLLGLGLVGLVLVGRRKENAACLALPVGKS